jgi:hypothetical protein
VLCIFSPLAYSHFSPLAYSHFFPACVLSFFPACVLSFFPRLRTLKFFVSSQQTAAASGDYTIAVPASTFGVLCLVRDSSVETRYSGAADRWARGTNVRNIRWALGSSQWPTVDYNINLQTNAVAVTAANRFARENTDSKLLETGAGGVVACYSNDYQ